MGRFTDRLSGMDSCAVSDALDKLGLTGSVTGLARMSTDQTIVGRVRTVKMDRAEGRTASRHLCTTAIEAADPGDVVVCEQRTGLDAACWGGNLTIAAQMRGVAGVIVEGPARDIDESRQLDFPVFARAATGRTARGRIIEVETGGPIQVGEVTVHPGDYVIADASSVVFIAQAEIERVIEAAEAIWQRETLIAQALREGRSASQAMGANYEQMLRK